ncbi:hypothetical protein VTI74DRAFT_11203 [Chaetomium olivicolor]
MQRSISSRSDDQLPLKSAIARLSHHELNFKSPHGKFEAGIIVFVAACSAFAQKMVDMTQNLDLHQPTPFHGHANCAVETSSSSAVVESRQSPQAQNVSSLCSVEKATISLLNSIRGGPSLYPARLLKPEIRAFCDFHRSRAVELSGSGSAAGCFSKAHCRNGPLLHPFRESWA